MAEIVNIFPKEIHARIDLSSKQVKFILDFLGRSAVEYDGEAEPELKAAVEYVTKEFFTVLVEIEKTIGQFR